MLLGGVLLAAFGACGQIEQLSAPQNLYIDEDEFLHWDEVQGADQYSVCLNDQEYWTTENCLDLFDKMISYDTVYRINVVAIGDMKKTTNSNESEEIEYVIPKPSFYGTQTSSGQAICANPNAKPVGKLIIPSNAVKILGSNGFPFKDDYVGFKDCTEITGVWIPDSVSSIGSQAFRGCTSLRRVRLPQGDFEAIQSGTFTDCPNLWDVKIPDNVTRIQGGFDSCSSLREITIPASVTELGSNPFAGCPLERIEVAEKNPVYYSEGNCALRREDNRLEFGCRTSVIPDTVKTISRFAFQDSDLTSLTLPEGLETIQSSAFSGSSLESIIIPKNVTSCESYAFSGCNELKSITVAEGNPVYYSEGNCLIERATKTLVAGCNTSVIPSDVETIGGSAFAGLNMTEIVIPESVKTIAGGAFGDCFFLKSIRLPEGLETIKREAFDGCKSLQAVVLPNSVTNIEDGAFPNLNNTTFFSAYSYNDRPDGWKGSFLYSNSFFWGCTFGYDGAYPYVISTADLSLDLQSGYIPYIFGLNYMCAPVRAGYTFAGWATEEGGEVVYEAYTVKTFISVHSANDHEIELRITFDFSRVNRTDLREELYGKTLYAVWILES